MSSLDIAPNDVVWPSPWLPLTDEMEALAFGRSINSNVANTVRGELHREIGEQHRLYGVECRAIAYNAQTRKVFLFETDAPDIAIVSVHFTWQKEDNPRWPAIHVYSSLTEFLESQCSRLAKSWQFWRTGGKA